MHFIQKNVQFIMTFYARAPQTQYKIYGCAKFVINRSQTRRIIKKKFSILQFGCEVAWRKIIVI